MTRECGVAAVTAGPGVTNSTSALAQALANDSPLFVIGGRAPIARWGMGSLQEMDHVEVTRSLTKKATTLLTADEAYRTAAECMRKALASLEAEVRRHPEQSNDYFFWPRPEIGLSKVA